MAVAHDEHQRWFTSEPVSHQVLFTGDTRGFVLASPISANESLARSSGRHWPNTLDAAKGPFAPSDTLSSISRDPHVRRAVIDLSRLGSLLQRPSCSTTRQTIRSACLNNYAALTCSFIRFLLGLGHRQSLASKEGRMNNVLRNYS
jgi:hypothetical protein